MRRPSLLFACELLLWVSASILVIAAAGRLLSYGAFQSSPRLFALLSLHTNASTLEGLGLHPAVKGRTPSLTPICQLKVPRLNMDLAVLEGDDEDTLSLGPGHMPSSAPIGSGGNAVIAGHRDMAFRALRNIRAGDVVKISGLHNFEYVVTAIHIVSPEDVSVLGATPEPTLTIITCYPFYFIGSAPKRFVVQAKKVSST